MGGTQFTYPRVEFTCPGIGGYTPRAGRRFPPAHNDVAGVCTFAHRARPGAQTHRSMTQVPGTGSGVRSPRACGQLAVPPRVKGATDGGEMRRTS